jgi:hypothetical protein
MHSWDDKSAKHLLAGSRLPLEQSVEVAAQQKLDTAVLTALGLPAARLSELYADTLRMGAVRRRLAAGRGTIRRERFESDVQQVAEDVATQLRVLIAGRQFPHDFIPAGSKSTTMSLGTASLHLRAEQMIGQRHIVVTSGSTTVMDHPFSQAMGEVVIRALQLGQRSFPLPDDDAVAEAALVDLHQLAAQLDGRLRDLVANAAGSQQASLRDQV